MKDQELLGLVRNHQPMTVAQEIELILKLSLPSMLAQLSTILMFYIDASMVGSLGAEASAAVGIVTSSLWVFGGLNAAVAMGFSVQVAHAIGANDNAGARQIVRQAYPCALLVSLCLGALGVLISGPLPQWLGGAPEICPDGSAYFLIFALTMPFAQLNFLSGSMLRCSGNMKVPSFINVLMCVLDVFFNSLFIFETRTLSIGGLELTLWGAGLGVTGAALGTSAAFVCCSLIMTYCATLRSQELNLRLEKGSFIPRKNTVVKAIKIGVPMALQHLAISLAQIVSTMIVAPLGIVAIAAHSFAITVESICYMPGNGISEAATTLVGQAIGARRPRLTFAFAKIAVVTGMLVMSFTGFLMYVFAPELMAVMTPDERIRDLAVGVLRIEAFAEPLFAAAIVAYGVFVGAGDTFTPCLMNLFSMWAVRLTAAALMAPHFGLYGVWIAMCGELCFRGIIFLVRLLRGHWLKRVLDRERFLKEKEAASAAKAP